MPSFYKTNLMDGYDSLLIPPEKDDTTFVINVNDANVEANTKPEKTVKKLANDYPYKRVLKGLREISAIAVFIWYIFEFGIVPHLDVSNEKLIQEEILKTCIFTNAIQLSNLLKIELNNIATQTEKVAISRIQGYNISDIINENFSQKYENLAADFYNLTKQVEQQAELRQICYKQNLEQICQEQFNSVSKANYPITFGRFIYICIFLMLITISFYCIRKAKKMELSPEQKNVYGKEIFRLKIVIFGHTIYALFLITLSAYYLSKCKEGHENNFEKFSL